MATSAPDEEVAEAGPLDAGGGGAHPVPAGPRAPPPGRRRRRRPPRAGPAGRGRGARRPPPGRRASRPAWRCGRAAPAGGPRRGTRGRRPAPAAGTSAPEATASRFHQISADLELGPAQEAERHGEEGEVDGEEREEGEDPRAVVAQQRRHGQRQGDDGGEQGGLGADVHGPPSCRPAAPAQTGARHAAGAAVCASSGRALDRPPGAGHPRGDDGARTGRRHWPPAAPRAPTGEPGGARRAVVPPARAAPGGGRRRARGRAARGGAGGGAADGRPEARLLRGLAARGLGRPAEALVALAGLEAALPALADRDPGRPRAGPVRGRRGPRPRRRSGRGAGRLARSAPGGRPGRGRPSARRRARPWRRWRRSSTAPADGPLATQAAPALLLTGRLRAARAAGPGRRPPGAPRLLGGPRRAARGGRLPGRAARAAGEAGRAAAAGGGASGAPSAWSSAADRADAIALLGRSSGPARSPAPSEPLACRAPPRSGRALRRDRAHRPAIEVLRPVVERCPTRPSAMRALYVLARPRAGAGDREEAVGALPALRARAPRARWPTTRSSPPPARGPRRAARPRRARRWRRWCATSRRRPPRRGPLPPGLAGLARRRAGPRGGGAQAHRGRPARADPVRARARRLLARAPPLGRGRRRPGRGARPSGPELVAPPRPTTTPCWPGPGWPGEARVLPVPPAPAARPSAAGRAAIPGRSRRPAPAPGVAAAARRLRRRPRRSSGGGRRPGGRRRWSRCSCSPTLLERAGDPTPPTTSCGRARGAAAPAARRRGLRALAMAYPPAYADLVRRYAPAAGVPPELAPGAHARGERARPGGGLAGRARSGSPSSCCRRRRRWPARRRCRRRIRPHDRPRSTPHRRGLPGRAPGRFEGAAALALAAYNAGENAVDRWWRAPPRPPLDEFVEEIPYDETRGYVKRVLRSYAATGSSTAAPGEPQRPPRSDWRSLGSNESEPGSPADPARIGEAADRREIGRWCVRGRAVSPGQHAQQRRPRAEPRLPASPRHLGAECLHAALPGGGEGGRRGVPAVRLRELGRAGVPRSRTGSAR